MLAADFGIFGGFDSEKIAVFKGVFSADRGRTEVGQRVRPLSQKSHFLGQRGGDSVLLCPGVCPPYFARDCGLPDRVDRV